MSKEKLYLWEIFISNKSADVTNTWGCSILLTVNVITVVDNTVYYPFTTIGLFIDEETLFRGSLQSAET